MDRRSAEVQDRLQRVVDAAARNGVAIYTADARGLFATFADASSEVVATESHVDTGATDASVAHQVLRSLAADTGGRAILNNNNLEAGIMKALEETAGYYLLAWRPDVVDQGKPKFRHVKVTIKTRPDLTVLARRGFFNASYQPSPEYAADNDGVPAANLPNYVLNKQLNSAYPRRDLPVFLYPGFDNDPQRGSILTISAQFGNGGALPKHPETQMAEIEVAYVLLNAEGKTVSSSGKKLTGLPNVQNPQALVSEFSISITPGLYQIRLAARDNYAGRVGSALEWIEIPRFEPNRLTLSSLFLSEQKPAGSEKEVSLSSGTTTLEVDRTFAQTSRLLCQTYIYNAALIRGTDPPQITMEISVFQQNKVIANAPAHSLATQNLTNFARIPYAFPLPLNSFPPGLYTIRVAATDRETKRRTEQNTTFRVQ